MVVLSPIDEILDEMARQEQIWGKQHHTPEYWLAIVMEEIGEAAMAILAADHNANSKTTSFHKDNTREELIQTAACIIHWIQDIDESCKSD